MNALPISDADLQVAAEKSAKLFGECECGHLLEYAVCPECEPDAHAKLHAMALAVERERQEQARRAYQEANRPNVATAELIETRRDAAQYVGLCRALRGGTASYLQLRLARRLTSKRAMNRARKETP